MLRAKRLSCVLERAMPTMIAASRDNAKPEWRTYFLAPFARRLAPFAQRKGREWNERGMRGWMGVGVGEQTTRRACWGRGTLHGHTPHTRFARARPLSLERKGLDGCGKRRVWWSVFVEVDRVVVRSVCEKLIDRARAVAYIRYHIVFRACLRACGSLRVLRVLWKHPGKTACHPTIDQLGVRGRVSNR